MYSRFTTNYMLNSDINYNNNNLQNINSNINDVDDNINQLYKKIDNMKEQINKLKQNKYTLEKNKKFLLLDELEEYMSKEKVVFTLPSQFKNLNTIGMPIKYFSYPLSFIGLSKTYYSSEFNRLKSPINCDNVYISDIPKPTNHIEELVYLYVKNLIEPHLPIKINQERYSDEGDRDWWILKPSKNDLNIYIY